MRIIPQSFPGFRTLPLCNTWISEAGIGLAAGAGAGDGAGAGAGIGCNMTLV